MKKKIVDISRLKNNSFKNYFVATKVKNDIK